MGTKERRQRQLEDREHRFLECARELIHEEGLLNLQMMRIAERSEHAVGTLYRHFSSKEDLLLALAVTDARQHVELFERVATWRAGSRERMLAIAVADMVFVQRHPEFFRLEQYVMTDVVWRAASPEQRGAFMAASVPVTRIVVQIVADAVNAGDLSLQDFAPQEICTSFWALCTGTHNLVHAEGVLEDFIVREPYRLMCRHVQVLLNGFEWRPLFNTRDAGALDIQIARIRRELFSDMCVDVPVPSRRSRPIASSHSEAP